MSTTKTVSRALVQNRVVEKFKGNPLMSMLVTSLDAALDVMQRVGVVPAIEINDLSQQGAVNDVIAIFETGQKHAPARMAALKESWPALHEALENLAESQQIEP